MINFITDFLKKLFHPKQIRPCSKYGFIRKRYKNKIKNEEFLIDFLCVITAESLNHYQIELLYPLNMQDGLATVSDIFSIECKETTYRIIKKTEIERFYEIPQIPIYNPSESISFEDCEDEDGMEGEQEEYKEIKLTVDEILDKINKYGISSLSEKEIMFLNKNK